MSLGNWTFTVCVSDVDETRQAGESPAEYVVRLAEGKARSAAARAGDYQGIVAADTAVVDGSAVLGKPADALDAVQMLRRLRGRSHQVYSGLAVLRAADGLMLTDLCVTDVPMRAYTDTEIQHYVDSGDPFDKAGAYAIQHAGFQPVQRLGGCYASVMGMPLCHLLRLLARMGFPAQPDLPAQCQTFLSYVCPVSSAILRGEQVG
jgi:MAF protein